MQHQRGKGDFGMFRLLRHHHFLNAF